MLNIIVPMAGQGSRFAEFGYIQPKPLIEIDHKPFFYYAASSLTRFVKYSNLIFVCLEEHNSNNILINSIKYYFPDAKIKLLEKTPAGAVLTVREALELIDNNFPIVCNDCDHLFYSDELYRNQYRFQEYDGFLMTSFSDNPGFSYVKKDKDNYVVGTVEKQRVSNEAISGIYGFKDADLFDKASISYLEKCAYNEFFISGLYNMPEIVRIQTYKSDFNLSFGTVDEFLKVKDSYIFNMWNSQ